MGFLDDVMNEIDTEKSKDENNQDTDQPSGEKTGKRIHEYGSQFEREYGNKT